MAYSPVLALVLLALVTKVHSQAVNILTDPPLSFSCLNISEITICRNIGWQLGSFPNWRDQSNPFEANQDISNYQPLIETECSNAVVHLLCAVYAPLCRPEFNHIRLPPCKELCKRVQIGCEPQLVANGFEWPPPLDCDRYPSSEETELAFCVDNLDTLQIPPELLGDRPTGFVTPPPPQLCPACLQVHGSLVNKSYSFAGFDNCAVPCQGAYFTSEERNIIAPVFILIGALVCVMFTLFTVATFLIDRHRFHYPERPIIYLSLCYLILSISYIVGSISKLAGGENDSFACSEGEEVSGLEGSQSFVFQSLPNVDTNYKSASCVILFVLVYYFQMASGLWWVILTLTWFLAAALKWGEEAVERLWILYHVIAWSIPAIQVILVMALQLVDGDQLAGLCYTGQTNPIGIGVFVFLPLTIYLGLGLVFLFIGFTALVNISRELKNDQAKSKKIGRLILRIGIYSSLYTLPNLILLFLYIYELANNSAWESSYTQCPSCQAGSGTCPVVESPSFAAFLIRYLMLFTVGICSTSWVLSSKTFAAWHRFFCSCGCRSPALNVRAAQNATYVIPDKKDGDLSMHHSMHHPQTAV